MKARLSKRALGFLAVAVIAGMPTGSVEAIPLLMDYTGFTWASLLGDTPEFEAVGVFDNFSPAVGVAGETYTFHMTGLSLGTEQYLGGGFYRRAYSGGSFRIHQSTSEFDRPYDYGQFPANGTAPATFTDGLYWLGGDFTSFSLLVDSTRGLATATGEGLYTEGGYYDNISENSFFTFAGLTMEQLAGVPPGYEYRMDGQVSAEIGGVVTPIPEPATLLLLGFGLLGAGLRCRPRNS